MSSFIISGSRGTDDPTMATLPFIAAKAAKEQGHDVVLWLWNEAVTLGRQGTADHPAQPGQVRPMTALAVVQTNRRFHAAEAGGGLRVGRLRMSPPSAA